MGKMLTIEVAYATLTKQLLLTIEVPITATVIDAINLSQIAKHFPEIEESINNNNLHVGIFGKKIDIIKYQLQDRDRVEIYRKLNKTPNQIRLERAKQS